MESIIDKIDEPTTAAAVSNSVENEVNHTAAQPEDAKMQYIEQS